MSAGKIPFSVDISRMIEVLAAQIYPSPFALLRENVQNSFDAILLRRHSGAEFDPRIDLEITPGLIRVQDNGIGMSVQDLRNHFWKAGSSSKNTAEARAAGVVGTFGIGAMANFGIARDLTVETQSARSGERTRCNASRDTLSVTEDCIDFEELAPQSEPGTVVTATMQPEHPIDVSQATAYISEFVANVVLPVFINGILVSQRPLTERVPELQVSWRVKEADAEIGPNFIADADLTGAASGEVRIDLSNIRLNGAPVEGRLILRQGFGNLRTSRSLFGLATAGVSSSYGLGGVADFQFLQPTAGREALTTESLQALQNLIGPIEHYLSEKLAARPESNNNSQFVQWAANHGRWDLCENLRIRIAPGENIALGELSASSKPGKLLVYNGSDPSTISLGTDDKPLIILSRQHHRQSLEISFLRQRCQIEELNDEPKVLEVRPPEFYSLAESALSFRLASVLTGDYFLDGDFRFGKISHGLPILVSKRSPVEIVLDADSPSIQTMLDIYDREYVAFAHMVKDFVRNVIFPRVSDLVPSATRQGAEAFLKSIQRNREIFEYETADLENLKSLWNDYLDGKITLAQAAAGSAAAQRSYQVIDSSAAASVRDVVPDVVENEATTRADNTPSFEAAPSIQRLDISTERKLLTIPDDEMPLKGYRCFLAITDRIRDDKGDFFLQPHRTSIVWGGQKALFIFEHLSGGFGLYYDLQTRNLISSQPGGGAFETCTIVMKNRTFIPIPDALRENFLPVANEKKRFEVRCDILYIDHD